MEHDFAKEQLNRYGVKIDLSFSEKEKEEVLKPAILYTKTLCTKKAMHDQLPEAIGRSRIRL